MNRALISDIFSRNKIDHVYHFVTHAVEGSSYLKISKFIKICLKYGLNVNA